MDQELKNKYPLTSTLQQIRVTGVDSGRILRFSFGPGAKNL